MSTRKSSVFYGFLIALSSLVVGMVIASKLDLTPLSTAGPLTVPATNSAPLTGPLTAGTFREIAHDAGPAVVSIITTMTRSVNDLTDLFGVQPPFGGRRDQAPQQEQVQGAGSGFIIDKAGYILTNNHVIEDATSIEVRLSSMQEQDYPLPAKVVGHDALTDTALIQLTKLPAEALTVSKFGDSARIAPGDWVMAIGNPFRLSNTVTVGVVSAVGRQTAVSNGRYEDFIQTDAAINRGNSGGPLLNLRGEVIGINTMIVTDQQMGGNVGIGFAVPINIVRDLLPQLREGKVVRGRIGVTVLRQPMTEQYAKELGLSKPGGAEVSSVERRGPADWGGVRVGDVITEFNGKPVKDNNDLVTIVAATTPGTSAPVTVVRGRKPVSLTVTVGELDLAQEQRTMTAERAPEAPAPRPKETAFGMSIQDISTRQRRQLQVPTGRGGAIVTDVTAFGAAAQAGLSPGDVILSIQGAAVGNATDTQDALDRIGTGHTARVIVWHVDQQSQGQEMLVLLHRP